MKIYILIQHGETTASATPFISEDAAYKEMSDRILKYDYAQENPVFTNSLITYKLTHNWKGMLALVEKHDALVVDDLWSDTMWVEEQVLPNPHVILIMHRGTVQEVISDLPATFNIIEDDNNWDAKPKFTLSWDNTEYAAYTGTDVVVDPNRTDEVAEKIAEFYSKQT